MPTNTKQVFFFLATAAVVYAWAYRRGVAVGTTQSSAADPFAAGGTDFLNWQAQ